MTGTWATGWATNDIVTAAEFKKSAGAIFDSTLGASASSVDVTSISNTYAHLMVSIYARSDIAAASSVMQMRFNGDSAANYDFQQLLAVAASPSANETFAATAANLGVIPAASAGANLFGATEVFIPHYAGAANNKQFISLSTSKTGTTTGLMDVRFFGGSWRSNAAINQITFIGNSFVAGTRVTIHALGA